MELEKQCSSKKTLNKIQWILFLWQKKHFKVIKLCWTQSSSIIIFQSNETLVKLLWVNFKIWLNWMCREFSSPFLEWCCSSSRLCGWSCFLPSSIGVVLRDDGSRPTETMEKVVTVDTVRRGRWGPSSPSDTDRDDGDGYPICFSRLCCFFHSLSVGWCSHSDRVVLRHPPLFGWCCSSHLPLLPPLCLSEQFLTLFQFFHSSRNHKYVRENHPHPEGGGKAAPP